MDDKDIVIAIIAMFDAMIDWWSSWHLSTTLADQIAGLKAESGRCPLGCAGRGADPRGGNVLAAPLPLPRVLPLRLHLLQPLSGFFHLSLTVHNKYAWGYIDTSKLES